MGRQLVTSQDLASFFVSTRRTAQELLPLLVRRLILATTTPGSIGSFHMPAGDDIRLHGWDGRLVLSGIHPFVPTGTSAWEMGTAAQPDAKADADYLKRTAQPLGADPAHSAFVFVTPQVWAGKQAWTEAKMSEGKWLDVHVIDGEVLTAWLDLAPAVGTWLNAERRCPVHDLDDVDASWRRTVESRYGSRVTPEVIIGGRMTEAATLTKWLSDPIGDLCIVAGSAEEVVAFVDAVVMQAAKKEPATDLSPRVLIARDTGCIHYLGALQTPHCLVVANPAHVPDLKTARLPMVSLIVPAQRATAPAFGRSTLELPPLRREPLTKALRAAGITEKTSDRIARESRGSLEAVLWAASSQGMGNLPWLQEPEASQLVPLVLAGQWTVSEHPDHEVLARLADNAYADVNQLATRWRIPGGPLQVWGNHWDWKAWRTNWEHLAPFITRDVLERFREVSLRVLGQRDPALDLSPGERWMAAVRNKVHPHSEGLRNGLVESIVMFSACSHRLEGIDGRGFASGMVRQLLDTQSLAASWTSLASWLPELAEAAPESFLAAAERVVAQPEVVEAVFTEGGMFGASSVHSHLLWALERLAWSPEYLSRVAILVGRFAEVGPGGELTNRPKNTLAGIFLPWYAGTMANLEQRLAAFDQLCKRCPDVGWSCGLAVLPHHHQIAMPTNEPQFHDWGHEAERRRTKAQVREFVDAVLDRLFAMADPHPDRWNQLAGVLPLLMLVAGGKAARLVELFHALDVRSWTPEQRLALWETFRDLVNRHAQYADADWAVEESDLAALRSLSARFTPTSARAKHQWLFEAMPVLGGGKKRSWQEEKTLLGGARADAVVAVLGEEGLPGAIAWADAVGAPHELGMSLAAGGLTQDQIWDVIDTTLLAEAGSATLSNRGRLGAAFVGELERIRGIEWRDQALQRIHSAGDIPKAVMFAVALRPCLSLWDRLSSDIALSEAYWRKVWLYYLTLEEAEVAVPRLLAVDRRETALVVAGYMAHEYDSGEVASDVKTRLLPLCRQVLAGLLNPAAASDVQSLRMVVPELLNFIERHDGNSEGTN
jgi:hypothetical protein